MITFLCKVRGTVNGEQYMYCGSKKTRCKCYTAVLWRANRMSYKFEHSFLGQLSFNLLIDMAARKQIKISESVFKIQVC